MSQVTLSATTSRQLGTRHSRRLRANGYIPAVVYGHGTNPTPVEVDAKAFRTAVSGDHGLNTVINLTSDAGNFTVMARVIQRHPVKGTVQHIDFQVIDTTKGVVVEVPIHVIGDAVDVRHHDWEVNQLAFSVMLEALPSKIPTHITVDTPISNCPTACSPVKTRRRVWLVRAPVALPRRPERPTPPRPSSSSWRSGAPCRPVGVRPAHCSSLVWRIPDRTTKALAIMSVATPSDWWLNVADSTCHSKSVSERS
jgi:ribosomal protein bL25 (Ctc-form)